MNYLQLYNQLIEKRRQNPLSRKDGYCEEHHIVPVSFHGSNDKSNKVMLTAKEHFIAHHIWQRYCFFEFGPDSWQFDAATSAMQFLAHTRKEYRKISARQYAMLRILFNSILKKRLSGKGNPSYNKKWMQNPKTGEFIYCKKTECKKYLEQGYIFRAHQYGKKMTAEQCAKIAANHADVSGKNNPMYGHPCTDFMTKEEVARWREHIKNRDLSGANNGAYGKKWIRNISTDLLLYLPKDIALQYVETGKWEFGVSKQHIDKMRNSLSSETALLKNLRTRFPDTDFTDFNYEYYRSLSRRLRDAFRIQYIANHPKK